MSRRISAFVLICLLALNLFLPLFSTAATASEELSAEPSAEEVLPEETNPDEMLPPETEPAESVPAETLPEESIPEEITSEQETPDETLPPETDPIESAPVETLPEASAPEESMPDEPGPQETIPSEISALQSQITVSQAQDMLANSVSVPEPEDVPGPGLYFGLLHAHSSISDGSSTPEELFSAARQIGMDFFAVTDLSDSFDAHEEGVIDTDCISTDWNAGRSAAALCSDASFVSIYGYEMNWPSQMQIGHISTFGSPGFQSWKQPAYQSYDNALTNYYAALSAVPAAVSQFSHPGKQYGSFDGFQPYSESADQAISALEIDFTDSKPLRYYTKALDQGWHVAPTGKQSVFSSSWTDTGVRTAVDAQSLTEAGILLALKQCRAYATEDPDLKVIYTLDGYPMGSRLDLRHIGQQIDISVTISDSTDSSIGLVEVITAGGEAISQQVLDEAWGALTFSLAPESGYYFLQITQPDGDLAVTAPIWVDAEEELSILDFSCSTSVPVQNEPISLDLEFWNGESTDFMPDSLTILADGVCVAQDDTLSTIPAQTMLSHTLRVALDCAGLTQITVQLSGTLEGAERHIESSINLNFRQSNQVTSIVVDGSHGNAGLENLTTLKTMAMDENIRLDIAAADISKDTLKNCRFLLIPAPSQKFSDAFLAEVCAFAEYGGSLVLCGQADALDDGFHSAAELNRLLDAICSDIRINDDTLQDMVTNNGDPALLNSDLIDFDLPWCSGISPNQVYRSAPGCSIAPGSSTAMVVGYDTTATADLDGDGLGGSDLGTAVLMCCGSLAGDGTLIVAGSLFLADENMAQPQSIWKEPYANRIIAQNLLGIGGETIPLSTIQSACTGKANSLFRVQGYVTAGTSNPYNTFPETIYLQDDTGAIAITPFSGESIQQGTPLEITGYLSSQNGNKILKLSSWKVLEDDLYQYPPLTGNWDTLLDPAANGNRLIQVEGSCLEVYCREDNTLSGCLLTDGAGNNAIIRIEDCITNGSDGENTLHLSIRKGRKIRAIGLLHTDAQGETVIRVRNCEEVVFVPPLRIFGLNPKTADSGVLYCTFLMAVSLTGLLLLRKRS